VALLHGRYHISDREIPQLLHDFFALPLSLGSVVDLQQSCSLALAPISSAIQTTVQQQAHITMDETGWKEAGKRRWFTQRVPGGGQRGCNTLSCGKQPWWQGHHEAVGKRL
jgi:hypothetical protein